MNDLPPDLGRRRIALLLGLSLAILAAAEAVARFAVPHLSRIEARVAIELADAKRIGSSPGQAHDVLVVGNSLLAESVLPAALRDRLAPHWRLHRLVVESTNYNDWYFGLDKLLADGARPEAVVLMLSGTQLATDGIRGTYTAFHLFSLRDSLAAGRRAGLHPTDIASLAAGHLSAYYGLREELRKFAFQRVVPGATDLVQLLLPHTPARQIEPVEMERIARGRFVELASLCSRHRVKCRFVLAPRLGPASESDRRILAAGEASGLGALALQGELIWGEGDFGPDRFHMNATGAERYTAALAPLLLDSLARP